MQCLRMLQRPTSSRGTIIAGSRSLKEFKSGKKSEVKGSVKEDKSGANEEETSTANEHEDGSSGQKVSGAKSEIIEKCSQHHRKMP